MATCCSVVMSIIPEPLLSYRLDKKVNDIVKRCTEVGDCLLWPERSSQGKSSCTLDGYGRIRLSYPGLPGGSGIETTVHRAMFILLERRPDLIKNKSAGDISHLCHKKRCVRRNHLVLESRSANMLRNECLGLEKCQCGQFPACIVSKGLV